MVRALEELSLSSRRCVAVRPSRCCTVAVHSDTHTSIPSSCSRSAWPMHLLTFFVRLGDDADD